jgi:hypothetical protein
MFIVFSNKLSQKTDISRRDAKPAKFFKAVKPASLHADKQYQAALPAPSDYECAGASAGRERRF